MKLNPRPNSVRLIFLRRVVSKHFYHTVPVDHQISLKIIIDSGQKDKAQAKNSPRKVKIETTITWNIKPWRNPRNKLFTQDI